MRKIGLSIILLVWLFLGWKMCQNKERCCPSDATTTAVAAPAAAAPVVAVTKASCTSGYVCFENGSSEPIYADNFNVLRDSLLAISRNGQRLTITGYYESGEKYSGPESDLGIARAKAIRNRLGSAMANDQVNLASQQIVGRTLSTHERVGYSFSAASTPVKDIATKTLIYFPYNSTDKLSDATIENYLDDVATRVSASGERVRLTGHTDSKGQADYNKSLGLNRAAVIRDYLRSKGVATNKITISSEGEASPVATNDTSAGRAQNRRTELEIIK